MKNRWYLLYGEIILTLFILVLRMILDEIYNLPIITFRIGTGLFYSILHVSVGYDAIVSILGLFCTIIGTLNLFKDNDLDIKNTIIFGLLIMLTGIICFNLLSGLTI